MGRAPSSPLDLAIARWLQHDADRGVLVTDDALVVRGWNEWLARQTGRPEDTVVGRHLFELYPTLVDRAFDQYYRDALAGEARVLSERLHKYLLPVPRNYHGVGMTEMSQAARIEPLLHHGRIVGTITIVEDVTERVVTERELRAQIAVSDQARRTAEEASRLKDEFLATLSHEIRTPLNAVIGWTRILRTERTAAERAHALDVIERNAMSQLRIVEDLLDMARVITGKLQLKTDRLSFEPVVRAALDVVTPGAKAKHVEIETEFEPDLPLVSGDADRLQQVVWNLLGNAVKFTDPGGRVRVVLRASGADVRLTVEDTGRGISREFLPYVFDRFRQADGTASRRHGGLGLGLALVRQIVELHGGSVGVDSPGVGLGTSFWVTLPVLASEARYAQADSRAGVTLEGVAVLVVEDDRDASDLLMALLTDYGAIVHTAHSGEEGLELLRSGTLKPDVIVSDLGMPGLDGYAFIQQMRALPLEFAQRVPTIALTAYANPEHRVRALLAGYQMHMPKPVIPYVLATAIADLVGRPEKASRPPI